MKHKIPQNMDKPESVLMSRRILPLLGDLGEHYRRLYSRWDGLEPERMFICDRCGVVISRDRRDREGCCVVQPAGLNCPPGSCQPEAIEFHCPDCGAKDSFTDYRR